MLICNVWDWFDCECSLEKSRLWREPDGGNLHVRFDEGEESGGHWSLCLSFRAFLSTLLVLLNPYRQSPHSVHCFGNFCFNFSTRANRSPCFSTRSSASFHKNESELASFFLRACRTSSHWIGVETVGCSLARSE
jgi:hypothetical protein